MRNNKVGILKRIIAGIISGVGIILVWPSCLVLGFFFMTHLSEVFNININQLGFDNNGWLSFWGGYISSIVTLFVLYVTTRQTRDIQKESHKNSIKPSVDIDIADGGWIAYEEDKNNISIKEIVLGKKDRDEIYSKDKNTIHGIWEIKLDIVNLSQNAAKNIEIIVEPLYEEFKENLKKLNMPFKYSDTNKIIEIENTGYFDFKKYITESRTKYRHLDSNRIVEHTLYYNFLGRDKEFNKLIEQYINTADYFITGDSEIKEITICTYNIILKYQDMELCEYTQKYKLDLVLYHVSKKDKIISFEINIRDIKID